MSPSAADVIRTRDAVPEPSSEQLDSLLRELSEHPPGLRRAALREHVIRLLLPMARRVTRRFQRHGEEFDDLVQVASLGLIKAVDGYDPALGHAFLSYAVPKVTGELRRHLRDRTATVRLPRPLQEASGRILQAVEELEQRLGGHSPTPEQIAGHTGLGQDRVLSALRAVHACRARSLDEPAGHDQEIPLACLVGAEDPALGRVVDTVSLTALVKRLPECDRRVLYLRFYREYTQQQIADAIGVSQMQVSRILRRCFDRLREALLADEPCAGAGEAARGPAAGRAARPARTPYGRRAAEEPVCPVGAAGPAPPAAGPAPRTRPAGPAPRAAAGTGPRRGHGHPVRRRRAGSRRRTCAGAVPQTARARPPPARRAQKERAPSPTGFVPPAEG
ncbi:sigma-70 family RNA polymerase sigma factor [Streptomyces sp. CB02400]|uniref:sigma-70 family RNA polymerase sigma factor n=1 Tax=Streptomyces sp. CB02400 TaxID=1703944 RepID=UPI0009388AC7|nr:sigma-70 family RNA polymerase sigma factor [Streptomyces sp. CB02400]